MDFITKIWNFLFSDKSTTKPSKSSNSQKPSIMPEVKEKTAANEIVLYREITDAAIQLQQNRTKYIIDKANHNYKVKSGDNLENIAKQHDVSIYALMALNNLTKTSVLNVGQILKIPPTHNLQKIKTLSDTANAMGISKYFILKLKRNEDSENLPDNKFHNTPYIDSNGVKTIGIGHAVKPDDKLNLTNEEVCQLLTKDLLKAEEALKYNLGTPVYEKLPINLKEALLDMVFNKGIDIIDKSQGIAYCLKTSKYEAAINKMTYNRSVKTNEEMSGLSKRRLFDISVAVGIYKNNNIPQSNINTAQQVYNRGVELLREECRKKGLNFENQIVGYNESIQNYFGHKITLKYITK